MTAVYDKLGLSFLYPENWKLIDESESGTPHSITLETPDGSAIWTVHVYPESAVEEDVLKETLATLQETYEDLEIAPYKGDLGGEPTNGVEALFYCLDFLVKAQLQFVRTEERLILFWTQAEDREFEKQEIVFNAISVGLLQNRSEADE
ncbi:MAG: hypothetical protein AB8B55_16805 [Mariniblastus sp.]